MVLPFTVTAQTCCDIYSNHTIPDRSTCCFKRAPDTKCSYLLSVPRSGNTWTRYCLETILGAPTLDGNGLEPLMPKINTSFIYPDQTAFVEKRHGCDELRAQTTCNTGCSKLILLIRDPVEIFLKLGLSGIRQTKSLLVQFSTWKSELRSMIRYENLIVDNPEGTYLALLSLILLPGGAAAT